MSALGFLNAYHQQNLTETIKFDLLQHTNGKVKQFFLK